MAVYTVRKDYHTRGNMGMIDVTGDFQSAVTAACREKRSAAGSSQDSQRAVSLP